MSLEIRSKGLTASGLRLLELLLIRRCYAMKAEHRGGEHCDRMSPEHAHVPLPLAVGVSDDLLLVSSSPVPHG